MGEVSFLDAVRSRYGAADDINAYGADALLVGPSNRRRNKTWELVGMDDTRQKQSDHRRLVHVVLRGMGITVAEHTLGEIDAAEMHRVSELDLSANPSLSLLGVGRVVRSLPALAALQLSEAPRLLAECPDGPLVRSGTLRKLVLHAIGLRTLWELRTLVELPALEELHLDRNGLSELRLCGNAAVWFPSVTTLSLAHNAFTAWGAESGLDETLQVAFPQVRRLFLTGNQLPNLPHPIPTQAAEEYAYLRRLELLCVNDNPNMDDARTVDAIRELCPHLTTFRITYGPLFPQWNETLGRMHVVASMPSITVLNRGQVRAKERLDSELFYIQRGLAAQQAEEEEEEKKRNETGEEKICKLQYPLLDTLREKHKDVILAIYREGETASRDGSTHLMLQLKLRCDGFEEATKSVPSSLTVGKLKALVRAIYSILPANQRLSYFSGDTAVIGRATELDNEMQSLGFYGVCDGSVIRVIDTSLR